MAKTSIAQTDTDICNLALIQDAAKLITSLTDGSVNAVLCQRLYPVTKDICVSRWEWNGVTKFADLGNEVSVAEQGAWEFVFNLPDDCLHVIAQIDEGSLKKKFKHKVIGKQLYTDDYSNDAGDAAYIEYISISDASKFAPELIEYIALSLAIKMAPKLMGISEQSALFVQGMRSDLRRMVLPNAIARNQAEGDPDGTNDEGESTWLTHRRTSGCDCGRSNGRCSCGNCR